MNTQYTFSQTKSGRDMLSLKTNQNLQLDITFENGDPDCVYINGYEFGSSDGSLFCLYVGISDECVKISDIVLDAAKHYNLFVKEDEEGAIDYQSHVRAYSVPSI